MKVLLWIVGGLVGLVALALLGLFAAGFRSNAGRGRIAITIARPPAEVFPWLTEPQRLTQWVSWLMEVRAHGSTDAVVGRRSTWIMNDRMNKTTLPIESELVAVEAPHKLAARIWLPESFMGGFKGEVTYTLEPKDGGTLFTYDGRFQYGSAMGKLFEPLVTPQAAKKLRADLERLKQQVESAPAPGLAGVR